MITSSNADFDEDGFGSVVRDLERAYLMLAELGVQGGDSPASTVINYNSELGGGNATMTPAVMGGTLLNTNTGSTIINKYNVALNGNWLDSSGVNPSKGNGGNARGLYAIDWQMYRSADTQVASGQFSTILGSRCTVSGYASSAIGFNNLCYSNNSYIIGQNNTSTISYRCHILGSNNTITGTVYNDIYPIICGSSNIIHGDSAGNFDYDRLSIYGRNNNINTNCTIYGDRWDNNVYSWNLYQRLITNTYSLVYGSGLDPYVTFSSSMFCMRYKPEGIHFGYNKHAFLGTNGLEESMLINPFYKNIKSTNSSNSEFGEIKFENDKIYIRPYSLENTRLEIVYNFGLNLISDAWPCIRINGTQILTTQRSAIANVTYDTTWTTVGPDLVNKFNDLLAKLRTHGIIAT